MNFERIVPSNGPAAVGPYSPGVKVGDWLYVSGQIPLQPDGELVTDTFEKEARQVLDNLKSVVEAAGGRLEQIVKVGIYVTDISRFAELNSIYAEYFDDSKPARSTVEVSHLPKGAHVEMDAIAYLG